MLGPSSTCVGHSASCRPTCWPRLSLMPQIDSKGYASNAFLGTYGHFLFVNNFTMQSTMFTDVDSLCLVQSWSIAIEFQLYVLTPPLFELGRLLGRRLGDGFELTGCLAIFSCLCLLNCALNIWYVVSTHWIDMAEQDTRLYIQYSFSTQYRFASYVCGVIASIALAQKSEERPPNACRWLCDAASKCIALAWVLIGSLFGGGYFALEKSGWKHWYVEHFHSFAPFHVALTRPLYGMAVAYLLALTCSGRAELLEKVLGWSLWQPLAALSYSMYLLQYLTWPTVQPLNLVERMFHSNEMFRQQIPGGQVRYVIKVLFLSPFLEALGMRLSDLPMLLASVCVYILILFYVITTAALAFVSYALVERPGIQTGKKFIALFQPRKPETVKQVVCKTQAAQREEQAVQQEKQNTATAV